jgi:predicted dehydrogenase
MKKHKLRWGVIGCAGINRKVVPSIQESELNEVVAIASRNENKAKEAALNFGIPKAYGSYEALLADDSIDAVYIPLPNHLHKEWTIKAAEAGKHVLCEKPMALNADEAKEMAAACQQAGVKLAEAYMYRHHPRYEMIKEIIASGEIGDVRALHGVFTFNSAANNKQNIRFQQAMGGGSIYDIGCYPLSAARLILGKEPMAATVHALFSPEHDNVDMMAVGLVEFPDSIGLTFQCGMWAAGRASFEIMGTTGNIALQAAYVSGLNNSDFHITVKGVRKDVEVPKINSYAAQVDNFARNVLYDEKMKFEPDDAVSNMRLIDACLKSAREHVRVTL